MNSSVPCRANKAAKTGCERTGKQSLNSKDAWAVLKESLRGSETRVEP
jgi:hypothetical protein